MRLKKWLIPAGLDGRKLWSARLMKLSTLLVSLTIASQLTYSQVQKTITGIVTSSIDNAAIPGVNVVIKGTTNGTVSDLNGKYSLLASPQDVLVFSSIGYLTEEHVVGEQTTINISLIEDITKLDEIVVVGYGTMKRSDLTGAVASVSADDIKKSVSTTLDQALQGRVAGVFVTQNTGQPGGSVSVQIRGINTFSNNEPLYVIDGIPTKAGSENTNNPLSVINPNDIVSMEVLKDASATAIYGSQASNGVILITTKRGEAGKTQVSYDGSYAWQQLPFNVEVMNLKEYAAYSMERYAITYFGNRDEYLDPSVLGKGTNWQNELFRVAPMQNQQFSVNSGTKTTQYNLSLGYFNQDGIAVGTDFDRMSARLNIDNKTFNWLNIGTSLNFSKTNQHLTVSDGSLINLAIQQAPDIPARNADGSFGGPYDSNFPVSNPLAEALLRENIYRNYFVQGNAYAEIKFLKNFTLRNEFGGNVGFNNNYYFNPTYVLGTIVNTVNSSTRSSGSNQYYIVKNYLTYNKSIGEHTVSLMAGHEAQEGRWESLSGTRTGFLTNNIRALDAGDETTSTNLGTLGSYAIESYFSRVNYSFKDKYLLTATYRADGSSYFGPKNRWGFFPSFAAAWKISNENFFESINFINNMKIRTGWGQVGNQNSTEYAYGSTMSIVSTDIGPGALQGRIANPYIQWESTEAENFGIDVNMFHNRVEFIADVYFKKTDNLLLQIVPPGYVGTDTWTGEGAVIAPWKNIGALENKGIELTLNTVNIDKSGFYWKSGFIFSLNRNKIIHLIDNNNVMNGYIEDKTISSTAVNQPIAQFYGYVADGIYNSISDFYRLGENGDSVLVAIPEDTQIGPNGIWIGDIKWKDLNNDSVINEKDRTFIGNPNPKFQLSINNYFAYKGFDLNIYITGVYGNKIYNYSRNKYEDPMSRFNMYKTVLDYAKVEKIDPNGSDDDLANFYISNPGGTVPRISRVNQNDNNRISTRFVEDGSYIRIKNISIGYTLPSKISERIKLERLRVYGNIQNVYTFSKYSGFDPEIGLKNQSVLVQNVDDGRYPSQRIYTIGINITY